MEAQTYDSLEVVNAKTRRAYNLAARKYHDLFHNEMNEKAYDRQLLDSFASKFDEEALICDAGCGPSGHIGRYVFDKGIPVIGVDISDRCIQLARSHNPGMRFVLGDIASLAFEEGTFDGIIAYYAIIDTPRRYMNRVFGELYRVLKPGGYLLVAVKAGQTEGYMDDLLGIETEIYFALFTEEQIASYYEQAGFNIEFLERRNPYDFEISNERIFAIGEKSYV